MGILREVRICFVSSFFGQVLGRLVLAKVFRPQLVSGLHHVGLHNSAIPAGFSQNVLAEHKLDTYVDT